MIKKIIIAIFNFFGIKINNNEEITEKEKNIQLYEKKNIMTEYERKIYNMIKNIGKDYIVIPQLNLATITKKISNQKYQNELYRNIDFAIFDKDMNDILLLIEIDDASHETKKRKDRDLKVKKICNDINVKLIKFYTKYPNEEKYVINRILTELKK